MKLYNQLIIRIQPNEGIKLNFVVKKPGNKFKFHTVNMGFQYADFYKKNLIVTAYDRLILNALEGDNILFSHNDVIDSCWNIIDPILNYLEKNRIRLLHFYPSGSQAPISVDKILTKYYCKY